jgi:recombination protein RecT
VSGQDVARRSPQQELVSRLRDPVAREQFAMVLPPSVTVEKFERIATTAILTNPDIAKLDHTSVLRAMVQAAADGLMPDGKEGAIVGRGGNAVWQPMIGGFRRQIAEFGWQLKTQAVYAADEFEWSDEPPSRLHRQARPDVDRGTIIGAYAVARHQDGREEQMFMRWAEIAKRRDVAATKAVWDRWPAEMSEKTVGRALCKRLPLAEADRERLTRVYDATVIDPAEAVRTIYGSEIPRATAAAEIVDRNPEVATTSPAETTERPQVDGDGTQQAAAAQPPRAAAAPGSGDELADEPGPEPPPQEEEVSPFQTPASVNTDENPDIFLAKQAAQITVPIGKWKGSTLGQVHAAGDAGTNWFRYALANLDETSGTAEKADPRMRPGELLGAIQAFAKVYLPDEFQAAAEKKAA